MKGELVDGAPADSILAWRPSGWVQTDIFVKLKDRKRSFSRKNEHNALWHYRNSHKAKFHVVDVFKQPRRGLG